MESQLEQLQRENEQLKGQLSQLDATVNHNNNNLNNTTGNNIGNLPKPKPVSALSKAAFHDNFAVTNSASSSNSSKNMPTLINCLNSPPLVSPRLNAALSRINADYNDYPNYGIGSEPSGTHTDMVSEAFALCRRNGDLSSPSVHNNSGGNSKDRHDNGNSSSYTVGGAASTSASASNRNSSRPPSTTHSTSSQSTKPKPKKNRTQAPPAAASKFDETEIREAESTSSSIQDHFLPKAPDALRVLDHPTLIEAYLEHSLAVDHHFSPNETQLRNHLISGSLQSISSPIGPLMSPTAHVLEKILALNGGAPQTPALPTPAQLFPSPMVPVPYNKAVDVKSKAMARPRFSTSSNSTPLPTANPLDFEAFQGSINQAIQNNAAAAAAAYDVQKNELFQALVNQQIAASPSFQAATPEINPIGLSLLASMAGSVGGMNQLKESVTADSSLKDCLSSLAVDFSKATTSLDQYGSSSANGFNLNSASAATPMRMDLLASLLGAAVPGNTVGMSASISGDMLSSFKDNSPPESFGSSNSPEFSSSSQLGDQERYLERRKRNNEAAKRCRANRRALFEYRFKRAQELEEENMQLKEETGRLTRELETLKEALEQKNRLETIPEDSSSDQDGTTSASGSVQLSNQQGP